MQYAISLGLALLPFVIVIVVCVILRKFLIRALGETHQVNSYILVIVPFMAVMLAGYMVCRPLFLGERSVTVQPDSLNIAAKSYTIDESWRKTGLSSIHTGDLVVFRAGIKDAPYNKTSVQPSLFTGRVIGTPGDRLQSKQISAGGSASHFILEINGQKASTTALSNTQFTGFNDLRFGLTVPEGSLWVTADYGSRKGVQDWDSPWVGPIRASQIVGIIHAWGNTDFTDLVDDTKKK